MSSSDAYGSLNYLACNSQAKRLSLHRFLGQDDCIYGVPQRSSGILRIIPPGVDRYGRNGVALSNEEEYIDVMYVGDEMVSCKDKFEGGVLGLDGNIYCIPLRAKCFIAVKPGSLRG